MSIQRRQRSRGRDAWQVTWRDPDGRQRAETYATRREAERRDAEIRDPRWQAKLDLADAGREPLVETAERWWTEHAEPKLARRTLASYSHVLDRHLIPRLGATPIRDIEPATVVALQRAMHDDGVGPAMAHRVLMVLSGIMRHAVVCGRIDRNPVNPVRIARPKRRRAIRPLAPESVERLRRELLARDDEESALLVSLMAYAGLRPGEAIALAWNHIGERTLLVEQASGIQAAKETKTGRVRTVRLLTPLAGDLASWRKTATNDESQLFVRTDTHPWTEHDYRNWRSRRRHSRRR